MVTMFAVDDKDLISKIRRVIVSNWFEVSVMRTRVIRGLVLLSGKVNKQGEGAEKPKVIAGSLRKLDGELRAVRGVRSVSYDFENWVQLPSGAWRIRGQEEDEEFEKDES